MGGYDKAKVHSGDKNNIFKNVQIIEFFTVVVVLGRTDQLSTLLSDFSCSV